ncbi:MAG: hypothetical protein H6719_37185 [Sandaracinaceae bacterium]|nr:hypothetical protein [Sandaracinaceae bacterium]
MITVLAAAAAALVPLVTAAVATRSATALDARRVGTLGMALALSCGVLSGATSDGGWDAMLPAFVAAIGLTAVSMSAAGNATPTRSARILLVIGATGALVVTDHPVALAIVWVASILPTWLELRARPETRPSARAFAAYLTPSAALVTLGALLLALGASPAVAVLPLAAGLAIREAMVPAHSWFPSFVEKAPMGLVVAFVAPQVGVYAHLRWLAAGLPPQLEDVIAALGAITVVLAAALGAVQRSARRALGYLLMSQTALVAFGLEAHSASGRMGALLAWLVCGIATAGFAMTTAALEARRGSLSLDRPSGSFRRIPSLASAYLLLGLASVGLPGTLGFVAEDLLVNGTVERFPVLGLTLILGTGLNSVTIVRGFFALFTGSRRHAGERDLTHRERAVLTLLVGSLLAAGLWPSGPIRWLSGVRRHEASEEAVDRQSSRSALGRLEPEGAMHGAVAVVDGDRALGDLFDARER